MTLLRMLAFYPTVNVNLLNSINKSDTLIQDPKDNLISNKAAEEEKQKSTQKLTEKLTTTDEFNGDWRALVEQLKLGLAKSLAQECELINYHDNTFNLSLSEKYKHLNQKTYVDKLQEELINHFNKKISLEINLGDASNSPSSARKVEKAALLKTTESAIMKDKFVNELMNEFSAEIVPSSIKPIKGEDK
jgi:DNA polymerase-3 subunit gamma/tau